MNEVLNEDLSNLIYSVVEEIPVRLCCNLWASARLIGKPKNARLVGEPENVLPLWRFSLPSSGKSPRQNFAGVERPERFTGKRGVTFRNKICVDLKNTSGRYKIFVIYYAVRGNFYGKK